MSIKINSEMQKTFKKQSIDNYLDKLVIHCYTQYPYLKSTINHIQLKNILQSCLDIAQKSGFTQEDTTRFYIDLIILFGIEFENDPQYKWLKNILSDYSQFTELTKAEVLYFDTISFLENAYGKKLCNKADIFQKLEIYLKELSIEPNLLKTHHLSDNAVIKQQIVIAITQIAQDKYNATSEEDFDALVTFGIERAKQHLLMTHPTQIIVAVVLMFIFGSHFDEDPFLTGINKKQGQITQIQKNIASISHISICKWFYQQFPWLEALIQLNASEQKQHYNN